MSKMPVVYSCSGCSSAGQMANWIAVKLDRHGKAEMSCIAGVGGGVKPLVQKAQSSETVVAIDGCPLHCALHSLRSRGVEPAHHVDLTRLGVRKEFHWDFDEAEAGQVYGQVVGKLDGVWAEPESAESEVTIPLEAQAG
jgi:uncharacterized metal-binding protein